MLWVCRSARRTGWRVHEAARAGRAAFPLRRPPALRPPTRLCALAPDWAAPPPARASALISAVMRKLSLQGPLTVQVSKLHTPEILVGRNELYPHIPTVRPPHSLPHDVPIHRAARGHVRHTQSLLQFNFLWGYQQAAVGIHDPGNCRLLTERPAMPVQLYGHWHARIHPRTAPLLAHSYVFRQVYAKWHPD